MIITFGGQEVTFGGQSVEFGPPEMLAASGQTAEVKPANDAQAEAGPEPEET